jgi:organic radical activating enzyme
VKGRIAEVFESIQGEGIYLGEKQLFVRFFGCNLNCKFCDTKLNHFVEYEPQELFVKLKLYPDSYHSVSFTGGEPLLQKDFLKEILALTQQAGFKNYLETNGTLPEALGEVIDYLDIVAMDLKLPSSTALADYWQPHSEFLKIASSKETFLKAVICKSTKEKDLKVALELIKEVNKFAILVLQPNSYETRNGIMKKVERFKKVCLENNITACIIPQLQRIFGFR